MHHSFHMSTKISVVYGFIFFCTSLIHNIFLVYHVHAFVAGFGISKFSFWIAEIIFLVWNTINDPLFGWMLDKQLLTTSSSSAEATHVTAYKRAKIISITGPFFAFVFFSTWFSCWLPGYPGFRFALVLCGYDTAVTILDLQKGALLADLVVSQSDRSKLGSAASIGQALSACGLVLITWFLGNSIEYVEPTAGITAGIKSGISPNFQLLAALLAAFSGAGLFVSGWWLSKASYSFTENQPFKPHPFDDVQFAVPHSIVNIADIEPKMISKNIVQLKESDDTSNMFVFLIKILQRRNFLAFSLMQAFQVFHCHFNSNFFPLFAKALLGQEQETLFCSLLGISFVLPHINNVILLSASDTYGTYDVIKFLFGFKVLLGVLVAFFGNHNLFVLSIFLASNRVFTEGVCKLLSQVISDLIDEDFVMQHRKQPLSALIFGASCLLGRPGQTVAPLFGYSILSLLTDHEFISDSDSAKPIASHEAAGIIDPDSSSTYPLPMGLSKASFVLAWSVSVVVGLIQLVIWSQYKLRGAWLEQVKRERIRITDKAKEILQKT